MKKNMKRFSELDDYKIHKKDQDVNDWIVRGEDNHIIGFVNDLLVDLELRKVVFLEVSLSDQYLHMKGRPLYILLPVSNVDLDKDAEEVYARVNDKSIDDYPNYEGKIITPEYMFRLQNYYDLMEKGVMEDAENKEPRSDIKKAAFQGKVPHELQDDDPVFEYELPDLRVKYLELKKELKVAQAEREIAILEKNIALAKMKKQEIQEGMTKKQHHEWEHNR